MKNSLVILCLFLISCRSHGFDFQKTHFSAKKCIQENRRKFLLDFGFSSLIVASTFPSNSNALSSYSANARNLERINSGDYSGGSTYDNNPTTEAGKKRRAMVGCKSFIAREEVAETVGAKSISEKECNQQVLGGQSEFMLQALRKLDCPASPYGICTERNWAFSFLWRQE